MARTKGSKNKVVKPPVNAVIAGLHETIEVLRQDIEKYKVLGIEDEMNISGLEKEVDDLKGQLEEQDDKIEQLKEVIKTLAELL